MKRHPLFSLLIAGCLLGWLSSALADEADNPAATPDASAGQPTAVERPAALPLEELRAFAEVFGRIKDNYVEPVGDRNLIESAIRGMLSDLDPHSAYLDADEYRELQVGTSGEFGGVGIEVGMEDGFVKVIAPIDDTPAKKAGLESGDLIVRIDDQPIKGMSLNDAISRMRGKSGTEIKLTIMRGAQQKQFDMTLKRAIIQVASVKSRMLEPGFGYVRLTHFQTHTTEDMLQALRTLEQENNGHLDGIVLDLRDNPGGILSGAVGVSDAFLSDGLIVYTKSVLQKDEMRFSAGPDDVLQGAPITVLVNGGSASASEIVAGALQDQRRAVIMGQRSFGKGSVQTIIPIDEKTALKLTTARYYTPSGRSIQAHGIEPDIRLEAGEFRAVDSPVTSATRESNLAGHLEREGQSDNPGGSPADTKLASEDYPLAEALNVLKGMALLWRQTQDADAEQTDGALRKQ